MNINLAKNSLKLLTVLGFFMLVSGLINPQPSTACEINGGGVSQASIIEEELAVEALD